MKRGFGILGFCLLAIPILMGCGGGGSNGGSQTGPPAGNPTTLPTQGSGSWGSYTFTANAVLIDGSTGLHVDSTFGDTMVISGANRSVIKAGSVLVSTAGNGALKKVLTVTDNGATKTVKTTQAALGEAFKKLDIRLAPLLAGSTLATANLNKAIKLSWQSGFSHRAARSRDGVLQVLKLELGKLAVSQTISLSGDVEMAFNPTLHAALVDDPNGFLPILTYDLGMSPQIDANVQISAQYAGELEVKKFEWGEPIVFAPIAAGPVIITPILTLESNIHAQASAKFSSNFGFSAQGTARVSRDASKQSTATASFTCSGSAEAPEVEGEVAGEFAVVEAKLVFAIYMLGGPSVDVKGGFDVKGVTATENGQDGIKFEVGTKGAAELGLLSTTSLFETLLGEKVSVFTLQKDLWNVPLYEHFFPFKTQGDIQVVDNGNVADDIFEVRVDGVLLGQTPRGGERKFHISDLMPGNHKLSLRCIHDESPPGTYGISLTNGITFDTGASTLSGHIDLGSSVDYTIIVPTASRKISTTPLPIPRNRAVEHS